MSAAVEDVHHRGGQKMSVRAAHVLVQRELGRLRGGTSNCQGGAQDGVSAELALVLGAIGLDHGLVDSALVGCVHIVQNVGDLGVNEIDSVQHALAKIAILVAVTKLDSFEGARRCAGRNDCATHGAVVKDDLDLNRGVAARIENLATINIKDDAHCCLLRQTSFNLKRITKMHNA